MRIDHLTGSLTLIRKDSRHSSAIVGNAWQLGHGLDLGKGCTVTLSDMHPLGKAIRGSSQILVPGCSRFVSLHGLEIPTERLLSSTGTVPISDRYNALLTPYQ